MTAFQEVGITHNHLLLPHAVLCVEQIPREDRLCHDGGKFSTTMHSSPVFRGSMVSSDKVTPNQMFPCQEAVRLTAPLAWWPHPRGPSGATGDRQPAILPLPRSVTPAAEDNSQSPSTGTVYDRCVSFLLVFRSSSTQDLCTVVLVSQYLLRYSISPR